MKTSKVIMITLIAGITAILCTTILAVGILNFKKTGTGSGVTATGSASCDFESDLIVWRGNYSAYGITTADAYGVIKQDAEVIKNYLLKNGITEDEMVFSSVDISQNYNAQYNMDGEYIGDVPEGFNLSQEVSITSTDVDKVEKISRDISALIESGVEFTSNSPEYYYTKLDELKLQLIVQATANAKQRIDIITAGSGAKTGDLLSANLGVFQITAQNSASDEYSYGGTLDTTSRNKTATITVKLSYTTK